ncbi:RNA-binding S4 domain-containing protein [Ferrovibrio sp.]|uniref:RNA-binding S4 domain-containing protein n=1 Tax=Ferrovibrio sp. TaxID=1917215 RepID=UPI0035AF6CC6
MTDSAEDGMRLDKWLVHARFCKTRDIAATLIRRSRIRINGRVVEKNHNLVRVDDVLTLPLRAGVKVLRVLALPVRRGPPAEAQACYAEIAPPTADSGD